MARRGSPSETSPTGTSPIAALLASFRTDGGGATIAAVFDFADTLIDGACGSMIDEQRRFGVRGGPAALARIVGAVIDSAAREQRVAAHLEQWVGRWAGRTEDDLAEVSERLFSHDCGGAAARLSHEAWRLVKAHQRAGHTVVIATSATRAQVAPLARELGVEHVLCTELGVRDGVLTGAVAGQVLQGPVKAARVWSFMTEHDIDAAASHAYTHSEQDVALLDGVGHPHPVNPSPALAAVASARGWPVLTFRSHRSGRFDPSPPLRTAAIYAALVASAGVGIALGSLNGNRRQGVDTATAMFDALAGPLAGIDIEVVGEQHAWSHRPAVFFINHQSTLIDLLVTTRVIRTGFTAVAKAEVKKMPVVGKLFDMAGVAFLDRTNRAKALQALEPAVLKLREGTSVIIAPEGTRSLTPRLGEFKKGGFHLAMQAGVPIVPIVIRNAGEIMWRNATTAHRGTVEVAVLAPVETDGWSPEDIDQHVHAVRGQYLETMAQWPTPQHLSRR